MKKDISEFERINGLVLEAESEENNGVDELELIEVDRNRHFILYEFNEKDSTIDSIPIETVNDFFPDFITKEGKGYLIEEY